MSFFFYWGFNLSIKLSAFFTFLCCFLRCIPCFIPRDSRHKFLWLIYLAQAFNALVGALYQGAASLLSALWFPLDQRTFSTAIAFSGGNLGMIVGYIFGFTFSTSNTNQGKVTNCFFGRV